MSTEGHYPLLISGDCDAVVVCLLTDDERLELQTKEELYRWISQHCSFVGTEDKSEETNLAGRETRCCCAGHRHLV